MYLMGTLRLPTPCSDKETSRSAGGTGGAGSIPLLGGSPGEGNSNPLQYAGLENP